MVDTESIAELLGNMEEYLDKLKVIRSKLIVDFLETQEIDNNN